MVPAAKGSQGSSNGVLTARSKKQRFSDRDSSKHVEKRKKKEGKREREGAKKKNPRRENSREDSRGFTVFLSNFQIKSKCARVVRVCIHVPSSA